MAVNASSVNYWPDSACAKAFWSQHELPPYQELLADTRAWLQPLPGQRWLDLGCGAGQLSRALWERSQGKLAEVVGVDCAAVNAEAYEKLRAKLRPRPALEALRFVAADFSRGLPSWRDAYFDGVVSGLALQYAEYFSPEQNAWTSAAYDRILAEVQRVLRPCGSFVFSVNVPEPSWGRVAWTAAAGFFRASKPLRYMQKAWRIWSYGNWLKREARRGRFHYLPVDAIVKKLGAAGFRDIEHRLSFSRQAYLLRCRKS